MAKLFPDSTRLGRATRPPTKPLANATKSINQYNEETITATGGTRTITVNGQTTSAIAFDATPATIVTALEALSTVGVGDVTVTNRTASNEAQTVTLGAGNTGGTFGLVFNGQTASGIAYNAPASAVQTALEGLSNVDPGDVVVSGSDGGPYTVTFSGQYANSNVPVMTETHSLTGGTNTVTIATTAQSSFKNFYNWNGTLLKNTKVAMSVDPTSLTGGIAILTKTGTSFAEQEARRYTQEALASKGISRSSSLPANDIEKLGQRTPKDIGDPNRIPGER